MNTISEQAVGHRRRRRIHSDEFKATVVASCLQPGMSMAAVAMANGINANLLRRWVRAVEMRDDAAQVQALPAPNPAVQGCRCWLCADDATLAEPASRHPHRTSPRHDGDVVPAEFFVHRHIRGKWTCKCCQVLVTLPIMSMVITLNPC